MTKLDLNLPSARPSRRKVLGGLGLTFAFALTAQETFAQQAAAPPPPPMKPLGPGDLNAWVNVHPSGRITIMAPVPEMGQATNTALPLIIAEEMDADWSKVRVETAPIHAAYDHPVFRSQFVVASLSTRAYFQPLRIAGAQARRVLMMGAASHWKVPLDEVTTRNGIVEHAKSNRRLGYGEVARFAKMPSELPQIKPEELKPVSQFRLIGKDVDRVDVVDKARGAATFAIDQQVPGLVYGTIARAPVMDAVATIQNANELLARKGILAVLPVPQGVGIVGARIEDVFAARQALKVVWSQAKGSGYDSDKGLQEFLADARNLEKVGVVGRKTGEPLEAMKTAARTISGEYSTDYAYHAQMEPLSCVASVTANGVDVWTGTQWPTKARDEAAKTAGVSPDKVNVRMMPMGGGYGRRAHIEYVTEAVALSKAAGKPVKMIASREDDLANAHCRPMTAHKIDVGLDPAGKILAWRHRLAADLVVPNLYGQARLDAQRGVDHIVMAHADVPYYEVATHQAEHIYEDRGVRTAAWRGIGAGPNAFAVEGMIDELAIALGKDPLAYRLDILKNPRAKAVVEKAAAMADWKRKREGTTLGLAFSRLGIPQLGEAMAATVVEVALDRASGAISVKRMWCAADVGLPIQPRNIRHQVEGSLVWGLSSALKERITFRNGAVVQSNFTDYDILRASEMPEITVEVMRSGDIPLPVGELGLGTVIPAVSNAVATMTGKRLRNAPFTKDRVKATLAV
jgi:isoquinoline 1-oxidoreductase subunit beta